MINNIDRLPYDDDVKSKLSFLVRSILQTLEECQKIILFGSYARAEYKSSSDFDILVFTKREVSREIRGELCSLFDENKADLVFYTVKGFENSTTLFAEQIRKEGILLWKN